MAKRKRRLPPRTKSGKFRKRASGGYRRNDPGPRKRRRTYRRRTYRANDPGPRKRRRSYRRNEPARRHRRRYRHNPISLAAFGLNQPTLRAVGFAAVGLMGTPFVEGFANQYIPQPADGTMKKFVQYAVKIGSALGVGFAAGKIFGKDAGRAALVGGGAYVVVSAIQDFFPGLLGGATAPAAVGGIGYQPALGSYPDMGFGSYITEDVPERLRPESRF